MKKSRISAAAVLMLGLICLCAIAQTPGALEPDLGSINDSTYTNKYFGLRLTVPAGWLVQDSTFKKQINEKGKENLTSDDPNKNREINRAIDNAFNLLTLTERTPGSRDPSMLCSSAAPKGSPPARQTLTTYWR